MANVNIRDKMKLSNIQFDFLILITFVSISLSEEDEFLKFLNGDLPSNSYPYTSFQRGINCRSISSPKKPKSLRDLQTIIKNAILFNAKVKVVGGLHSASDAICTDGIVINMTYINHFSFNPENNHATIGAGAKIGYFLDKLAEVGRSLPTSPSFNGISVGGATGTGAIGSGLINPATLSDQIVSLTFIDGLGNIREISENEEEFKAFIVHLGLLGVIYQLVIKTVPLYKLRISTSLISDSILFKYNGENLLRMAREHRGIEFSWYPSDSQLILFVADDLSLNISGNCESHLIGETSPEAINQAAAYIEQIQALEDHLDFYVVQSQLKRVFYTSAPGWIPIYADADNNQTSCLPVATGYSNKMMVCDCKSCVWEQGKYSILAEEFSISIPLNEFGSAIKSIKDILSETLTLFPLIGIYFKFVKRSDAFLGISGGEDVVNIEFATVPRFNKTESRLGITGYQAMGQALLKKHSGRPHWGKNTLYFSTREVIDKAYPDLQKFITVMNKVDPNELFMNDFGRRLKYGRNEMSAKSEDAMKRCALNVLCACENDMDCGNGELDMLVDNLEIIMFVGESQIHLEM